MHHIKAAPPPPGIWFWCFRCHKCVWFSVGSLLKTRKALQEWSGAKNGMTLQSLLHQDKAAPPGLWCFRCHRGDRGAILDQCSPSFFSPFSLSHSHSQPLPHHHEWSHSPWSPKSLMLWLCKKLTVTVSVLQIALFGSFVATAAEVALLDDNNVLLT